MRSSCADAAGTAAGTLERTSAHPVIPLEPQTADFILCVQVMGLAHKADIHQMFEVLRSEGELQLIGAEAGILENKWRKCAFADRAIASGSCDAPPQGAAVVCHSLSRTYKRHTASRAFAYCWIVAAFRAVLFT